MQCCRPAFIARQIRSTAGTSSARSFASSTARRSEAKASDAASRLMDTFAGKYTVQRQLIDGNQLQKLSLTLGRTTIGDHDVTERPPPTGTPVPAGYHLVYFTPNGLETELGADGSDRTYNAAAPFSRRMWAGGNMTWPTTSEGGGKAPLMRVGDEIEERTKLLNATPKKSRSAGEMVLVEVEKEFWGPQGLALVDNRSWIFRPEVDPTAKAADPPAASRTIKGPTLINDIQNAGSSFPSREFCWSPVGLFRFSALTFNGHKIHYNEDWSNTVEGHPGLVVHGPLNLISILNYWRDVHGNGQGPRHVKYRAMAPLYSGDKYHVSTTNVAEGSKGREYEISAQKEGTVCMKAEIR